MGEFVPYEEVDHTADYALVARGRTFPELLLNASVGLCHLLADVAALPAPAERRAVRARAPSRERLLVGWLRELLFLHETEDVAFSAIGLDDVRDSLDPGPAPRQPAGQAPGPALAPRRLVGQAARLPSTPPGTPLGDGLRPAPALAASGWADLVPADAAPDALRAQLKAVTYHDLEIEENHGLLQVRIVFDT